MHRLLLVLALCLPAPLHAQMQLGGAPQTDSKKFVVFIHTGPTAPDDPKIKQIAISLLQKGYLVRAPDGQRDQVGGPGVDYFDASAASSAQDVAKTVNELLPKMGIALQKPLMPRLQQVKNPPGYLGLWLF
jgi:hypothetical protein